MRASNAELGVLRLCSVTQLTLFPDRADDFDSRIIDGSIGVSFSRNLVWDNFVAWVYNNQNNNTSQAVYAVVDNTRAYSGNNSVHFKGGAQ